MITTHRPLVAALAAACAAAGLAACGTPSLKSSEPSLTPPTLECSAAGRAASDLSSLKTVCLLTSQGEVVLELDPGPTPATATVDNFLTYVNEGFYDLTLVHRVIPRFVIQGGGFNTSYNAKPTHAPIPLESANGLHNLRGTIAMARQADPAYDSAASQFFLNLVDNPALDYDAAKGVPNGYAVFGRVISGMDAVDRIGALPTYANAAGTLTNLPSPTVIVYWARQLK